MQNRNALAVLGRSGNPVFRGNAFAPDATFAAAPAAQRMTLGGTVNKTGILLILCLATASIVWNRFFESGNPASIMGLLWLGLIGGLGAAIVTMFKRQWAAITAPLYALLQGLVLGGISAIFEAQYPGIVIQAIGLTFGTLGVLLRR